MRTLLFLARDLESVQGFEGLLDHLSIRRRFVHLAIQWKRNSGDVAEVNAIAKRRQNFSYGWAPSSDGDLGASAKVFGSTLVAGTSIKGFLERLQPDLMVVTSTDLGSFHSGYVRGARELGIPIACWSASLNDMCSEAIEGDPLDCLAVWNAEQRTRAIQRWNVPPERIAVLGSPIEDRWFSGTPSISREQYCARLGLNGTPSVISCFQAGHGPRRGPSTTALTTWITSVRSSKDQRVSRSSIVVWLPDGSALPGEPFENVAVLSARRAGAFGWSARDAFFHTAYYSDAVISSCVGAAEAGVLGRRVLSPGPSFLVPGERANLPSWVRVAEDLSDHLAHLSEHLSDGAPTNDSLVASAASEFLRPYGVEMAPVRLFEKVLQEMVLHPPIPVDPPRLTSAVKRALLPAFAAVERGAARRALLRDRAAHGSARLRILLAAPVPDDVASYAAVIDELIGRDHYVSVGSFGSEERSVDRKLRRVRYGAQVAGRIPQREGFWALVAERVRGTVEFVRCTQRETLQIGGSARSRLGRVLLPRGLGFLTAARWRTPAIKRAIVALTLAERALPACSSVRNWLIDGAFDRVILLPPLAHASSAVLSAEVDLIKEAKNLGMPTVASMTNGEWWPSGALLAARPDAVLAWSGAQEAEATRLHGLPSQRIARGQAPTLGFRRRGEKQSPSALTSIPRPLLSQRFVIFVCSSGLMSDAESETQFVRSWIRALRRSDDPRIRALGIVIRPDRWKVASWKEVDLSASGPVEVWPPEIEPDNHRSLELFASAVAVVGNNAGAIMDALSNGTPALAVAFESWGYEQLTAMLDPPLLRRGLRVASSLDEHMGHLQDALTNVDGMRDQVSSGMQEVQRNGPPDSRWVELIEHLHVQPAATGARAWQTASSIILRIGLLGVACVVALWGWVAGLSAWGKFSRQLRMRSHRGRKEFSKALRRTRGRFVRAGRIGVRVLGENRRRAVELFRGLVSRDLR